MHTDGSLPLSRVCLPCCVLSNGLSRKQLGKLHLVSKEQCFTESGRKRQSLYDTMAFGLGAETLSLALMWM